ncbi:Ribonuclease H2 subunit A [Monoraphidium neglectum]|uniref:Ribonuclease n=1 Tax=Monoraphidium neglectum TaxID=145388 RepID=A0A0D2MIS6_9CHLO|nr:Ribonuclease H2 subunit A [Monoraphidium neglectum]KIY94910.1 Ribonuclease H2 subunit A [Monoraphidium neglectum]|eukprot:XP_013893930.1 Ribonuclease H2 subunit A [Monoraphidium neglectum]
MEADQQQEQGSGGARGVAPPDNMEPARDWFSGPCIMGIDEAGRGPVLGPMVYACVVASVSYKADLATKAYADSKTLTEAQREALFGQVVNDPQLAYRHDTLSAALISAQMLGRCPA